MIYTRAFRKVLPLVLSDFNIKISTLIYYYIYDVMQFFMNAFLKTSNKQSSGILKFNDKCIWARIAADICESAQEKINVYVV